MRYVLGVLLFATPSAAEEPRPAPPPARPTVVVAPPVTPAPLRVRGPLRVRFAAAATDVIADTTVRVLQEVPRAVADSVRSGNARVTVRFSVTRTPPPAAPQP